MARSAVLGFIILHARSNNMETRGGLWVAQGQKSRFDFLTVPKTYKNVSRADLFDVTRVICAVAGFYSTSCFSLVTSFRKATHVAMHMQSFYIQHQGPVCSVLPPSGRHMSRGILTSKGPFS